MIDFDTLVLGPCMRNFGQEITFISQEGPSIRVYGIFDEVTRLPDPIAGDDAGDSGVIGLRAVVGVRLSDFPRKPFLGDRVVLSDKKVFYVQEVQVDGQGGAHLVLNSAMSVAGVGGE